MRDSMVTVVEHATLQDVVDALEAHHVDTVGVTDVHGRLVGTIRSADLIGIVESDHAVPHANGGPGLRRRRTVRARATAAELMSPAAPTRRMDRRNAAPAARATVEGAVR